MTKNYLRKFIKYAKKVYRIEEGLKALRDGRKNPSYTTGEVYELFGKMQVFCTKV